MQDCFLLLLESAISTVASVFCSTSMSKQAVTRSSGGRRCLPWIIGRTTTPISLCLGSSGRKQEILRTPSSAIGPISLLQTLTLRSPYVNVNESNS
ncbi:hypothetical protein R3P38DRAFT_2847067 [Favolaschia claudopus]|uniref:Secreted protein n=1 Tax=Favolaschia claudopus TaxID=2862362 RepID=A0AAW0DW77_9AGAR